MLCLAASLLLPLADASDWPRFRGPGGEGVALQADPPLRWSESGNIRWSRDLDGHGWSSPVVLDDRIYLTSARKEGSSLILAVSCHDALSGDPLWSRDVLAPAAGVAKHGKNSHASPTPVAGEGRIWAHFGHYGTVCLDDEGRVLWTQTSLSYDPVHGNGSSPVLVGRRLVFSADGREDPSLIALDAGSGEVLWRRVRHTDASRKFSFSTPTVIEVGGREQIVSPASGAVFGYDPQTGDELWRVDYGQGYSVVPLPVFAHDHVFVATGFDRPNLLAIRTGGRGNITDTHIAWRTSRSVPRTPSVVLHGDEIYYISDGGVASCLDARTGRQHWQERIGGNVSASPVLAGDRLYIATEEGRMAVVRASTRFGILAENEFGERIFATPAITGDALIVRTESRLYRIEKS